MPNDDALTFFIGLMIYVQLQALPSLLLSSPICIMFPDTFHPHLMLISFTFQDKNQRKVYAVIISPTSLYLPTAKIKHTIVLHSYMYITCI